MTEYQVSVHYDEGTVLYIEANNASEAWRKLTRYCQMKLV